jgi:hypothetical protein
VVLLLIYYVGFVAIGDFVAYLIGTFVEYFWGSIPSLVVFLGMYFFTLWAAWVIAVKVSEPKKGPSMKIVPASDA